MPGKNKSNELKLSRVYDAPVAVVWDAWTDPKKAAKWWGPRGFTLTTHSKDLRVGGIWHYTMHGPDGVDWPNKTKYLEVEERSRLVYDHGGNDEQAPLFRVTVTFKEVNGKTRMDMTMALPTPEAAEQTRGFIKKAGGDSTWDRLAEYLTEGSSGKNVFVINRCFDAPVDVVFEAWTNPEQISRWIPPTGFTMKYLRADIRPGGSTLSLMTDGGNISFHAKANYVEISRPNRIVYTQEFCDENEKTSRHPMAPVWPASMLTTVTLSEEAPDRTRVTVTSEPHGGVSAEELAAFISARAGMTGGWTGSFDKLEAQLEAQTEKV